MTGGLFAEFSDADLIDEMKRLAATERRATADVIRALMEFDARKLHLAEGYSSLFAYCTQVLHYAEHAALNRIEVARAARQVPALLEHVADGRLSLTGARVLAPHLTEANCDALLASARYKTKREIEEIVMALCQQPAGAATAGRLLSPRSTIAPAGPDSYQVQFTITREIRDRLRTVQDLMRHSLPNGDVAEIFARALHLLHEDLKRKRFAEVTMPRRHQPPAAHSRHIPAAVKREVWRRDGGRCAFVGGDTRCNEQGFLEYHHLVPFAAGGTTTVDNIELRCRAHNAYEAMLYFGN